MSSKRRNEPQRDASQSVRVTVAEQVLIANLRTLPARRVPLTAALTVADRVLAKSSHWSLDARAFAVTRAVDNFLELATKGTRANRTPEHTDLLPVHHPASTALIPNALTASALLQARAEWHAADPRIDDSVRPLVAAAYSLPLDSIEREHALARLHATPLTLIPREVVLAAAGFGGLSHFARSLRAKRQLRDRFGQFAYEGKGGRFKVRVGKAIHSVLGLVVGGEAGKYAEIYITKDDKNTGLKKGQIVKVHIDNFEAVDVMLTEEQLAKAGIGLPEGKILADKDAQTVEELLASQLIAPTDWKPSASAPGVYTTEDGFTATSNGDGTFALTDGYKNAVPGFDHAEWPEIQRHIVDDAQAEHGSSDTEAPEAAPAAPTGPISTKNWYNERDISTSAKYMGHSQGFDITGYSDGTRLVDLGQDYKKAAYIKPLGDGSFEAAMTGTSNKINGEWVKNPDGSFAAPGSGTKIAGVFEGPNAELNAQLWLSAQLHDNQRSLTAIDAPIQNLFNEDWKKFAYEKIEKSDVPEPTKILDAPSGVPGAPETPAGTQINKPSKSQINMIKSMLDERGITGEQRQQYEDRLAKTDKYKISELFNELKAMPKSKTPVTPAKSQEPVAPSATSTSDRYKTPEQAKAAAPVGWKLKSETANFTRWTNEDGYTVSMSHNSGIMSVIRPDGNSAPASNYAYNWDSVDKAIAADKLVAPKEEADKAAADAAKKEADKAAEEAWNKLTPEQKALENKVIYALSRVKPYETESKDLEAAIRAGDSAKFEKLLEASPEYKKDSNLVKDAIFKDFPNQEEKTADKRLNEVAEARKAVEEIATALAESAPSSFTDSLASTLPEGLLANLDKELGKAFNGDSLIELISKVDNEEDLQRAVDEISAARATNKDLTGEQSDALSQVQDAAIKKFYENNPDLKNTINEPAPPVPTEVPATAVEAPSLDKAPAGWTPSYQGLGADFIKAWTQDGTGYVVKLRKSIGSKKSGNLEIFTPQGYVMPVGPSTKDWDAVAKTIEQHITDEAAPAVETPASTTEKATGGSLKPGDKVDVGGFVKTVKSVKVDDDAGEVVVSFEVPVGYAPYKIAGKVDDPKFDKFVEATGASEEQAPGAASLVMPKAKENEAVYTREGATLQKKIDSLKKSIALGEEIISDGGENPDQNVVKSVENSKRELKGLEFVEAYRKQTHKARVSAPSSVLDGTHEMFNEGAPATEETPEPSTTPEFETTPVYASTLKPGDKVLVDGHIETVKKVLDHYESNETRVYFETPTQGSKTAKTVDGDDPKGMYKVTEAPASEKMSAEEAKKLLTKKVTITGKDGVQRTGYLSQVKTRKADGGIAGIVWGNETGVFTMPGSTIAKIELAEPETESPTAEAGTPDKNYAAILSDGEDMETGELVHYTTPENAKAILESGYNPEGKDTLGGSQWGIPGAMFAAEYGYGMSSEMASEYWRMHPGAKEIGSIKVDLPSDANVLDITWTNSNKELETKNGLDKIGAGDAFDYIEKKREEEKASGKSSSESINHLVAQWAAQSGKYDAVRFPHGEVVIFNKNQDSIKPETPAETLESPAEAPESDGNFTWPTQPKGMSQVLDQEMYGTETPNWSFDFSELGDKPHLDLMKWLDDNKLTEKGVRFKSIADNGNSHTVELLIPEKAKDAFAKAYANEDGKSFWKDVADGDHGTPIEYGLDYKTKTPNYKIEFIGFQDPKHMADEVGLPPTANGKPYSNEMLMIGWLRMHDLESFGVKFRNITKSSGGHEVELEIPDDAKDKFALAYSGEDWAELSKDEVLQPIDQADEKKSFSPAEVSKLAKDNGYTEVTTAKEKKLGERTWEYSPDSENTTVIMQDSEGNFTRQQYSTIQDGSGNNIMQQVDDGGYTEHGTNAKEAFEWDKSEADATPLEQPQAMKLPEYVPTGPAEDEHPGPGPDNNSINEVLKDSDWHEEKDPSGHFPGEREFDLKDEDGDVTAIVIAHNDGTFTRYNFYASFDNENNKTMKEDGSDSFDDPRDAFGIYPGSSGIDALDSVPQVPDENGYNTANGEKALADAGLNPAELGSIDADIAEALDSNATGYTAMLDGVTGNEHVLKNILDTLNAYDGKNSIGLAGDLYSLYDVLSKIGVAPKVVDYVEKLAETLDDFTPAQSDNSSNQITTDTVAEEQSATHDLSDFWKNIGGQKGSNTGGTYENPTTGEQVYVKIPKSQLHGENERLASALYQAAGISAAHVLPGKMSGKDVTYSPIIEDAKQDLKDKLKDKAYMAKLQEGFAMDALLANWDVIGLTYDNIVTDKNGEPVRIDPGGSLLFRAQGAVKGDAFGSDVPELDSFTDKSSTRPAAKVFSQMTDEQKLESAKVLQNLAPSQIDELVDAIITDPAKADELKTKLKARRDYILNKFGLGGGGNGGQEPTPSPKVPDAPGVAELADEKVRATAASAVQDQLPAGFTVVHDPASNTSGGYILVKNSDGESVAGLFGDPYEIGKYVVQNYKGSTTEAKHDSLTEAMAALVQEVEKVSSPEAAYSMHVLSDGSFGTLGAKVVHNKNGITGTIVGFQKDINYVKVKPDNGDAIKIMSVNQIKSNGSGGGGTSTPSTPPAAPSAPSSEKAVPSDFTAKEYGLETVYLGKDGTVQTIGVKLQNGGSAWAVEDDGNVLYDGIENRAEAETKALYALVEKANGKTPPKSLPEDLAPSKSENMTTFSENNIMSSVVAFKDVDTNTWSVSSGGSVVQEGLTREEAEQLAVFTIYAANLSPIPPAAPDGSKGNNGPVTSVADAKKYKSDFLSLPIIEGPPDLTTSNVPEELKKDANDVTMTVGAIVKDVATGKVGVYRTLGFGNSAKIRVVWSDNTRESVDPNTVLATGKYINVNDATSYALLGPLDFEASSIPIGDVVPGSLDSTGLYDTNGDFINYHQLVIDKNGELGVVMSASGDAAGYLKVAYPDGTKLRKGDTLLATDLLYTITDSQLKDSQSTYKLYLKGNLNSKYNLVEFGKKLSSVKGTPSGKISIPASNSPGAKPENVQQLTWDQSDFKDLPALETLLATISGKAADDKVTGLRGGSIALDADAVEDLDLRIMSAVSNKGEASYLMKYKLTSWAGDAFTNTLLDMVKNNDPRVSVISGLKLPSNKVVDGAVSFEASLTSPVTYHSSYGQTFVVTLDDGTQIHFMRADVPTSHASGATKLSAHSPKAFHNKVMIITPQASATPESMAMTLNLAGISTVRPSTEQDAKILIENRLMSIFDEKVDPTTNPSGDARQESLDKIMSEWGISPADVSLVAGAGGRVEMRLTPEAAKKIVDKTGVKALRHNLSSTGKHGMNGPVGVETDEEAKDRIAEWFADRVATPQGGLLATATRWTEGVPTGGQSSSADVDTGGADYVFTTPRSSVVVGTSYYLVPTLWFDAERAFQRLDFWANEHDEFGKRKGKSPISQIKPHGYEVMFKGRLSYNDAEVIFAKDEDMRTRIITKLRQKGINELGGRPLEQVIQTDVSYSASKKTTK